MLYSEDKFGAAAAERYQQLLVSAMKDVAEDPTRPGTIRRSEIPLPVSTYHLGHSRRGAADTGVSVHRPRHLLVYRILGDETVEIARILHDAMELPRHLPAREQVTKSD